MISKEILERICKYANKQCEIHNVDVDFIKDLILLYVPGDWQYAIGDSKHFIQCKRNQNVINLGAYVPWHLEAYDKYINHIHMFSPEIPLSHKAYDAILTGMLTGCNISLNARNVNEINEQIEYETQKFNDNAKKLVFTKNSDPNYLIDARKLVDDYSKIMAELNEKAHPTIILVPNDVTSISQLCIWLDLNVD